MGFTIDYGPPGLFGMAFILIMIFSAVIALAVVLRSAKVAHDEVVQEIEDEGGDLKG